MKFSGPMHMWLTGVQMMHLAAETQAVIAMRMLGMVGFWPVSRTEAQRMWAEKPGAFVEAGGAAAMAAMQGKRPDQIADAAIRPLRKKTRANSRRLAKRGRR